ncbi:MAG: hypothetical protein AB1331_00105 [Bacillota bacterium]
MYRLNRDLRFMYWSLFSFSLGMGLYIFVLPNYIIRLGPPRFSWVASSHSGW